MSDGTYVGPRDGPWKDENKLRELYHGEKLTKAEVARRLDCSTSTIDHWFEKFGIETKKRYKGNLYASFKTDETGHEVWVSTIHSRMSGSHTYPVHRLLAVAEYGFEAVKDMHVHHKNEIPWDNRVGNIQLLTGSEHRKEHRKFKSHECLKARLIHKYGVPKQDVAKHFDVSPGTIYKHTNDHCNCEIGLEEWAKVTA